MCAHTGSRGPAGALSSLRKVYEPVRVKGCSSRSWRNWQTRILLHASPCRGDASKQGRGFEPRLEGPRHVHKTTAWSKRMKVELVPPDSDTQPRHWVRHDQAFAMMLGPGSIEWGSKRSALEKFAYAAGDLALCDRHNGEWVGLMNVPHLQLGISDAALTAATDEADGEIELHPHRKFADSRLGALVNAVHAEMLAGFPSGRLFLDSIEQAMAVALVSGQAVRSRPVKMSRGGLGSSRLRRITDLVHTSLEDELGLDELAQSVGLSKAHFARMFRKSTGETPHQFVCSED